MFLPFGLLYFKLDNDGGMKWVPNHCKWSFQVNFFIKFFIQNYSPLTRQCRLQALEETTTLEAPSHLQPFLHHSWNFPLHFDDPKHQPGLSRDPLKDLSHRQNQRRAPDHHFSGLNQFWWNVLNSIQKLKPRYVFVIFGWIKQLIILVFQICFT